MDAMIADNKKTGQALRFVLLEELGQCCNTEKDFLVTVDQELVEKVVENFIQRQHQKIENRS